MKRTDEQLSYSDFLGGEIKAAGGGKPYRLSADVEGYPRIPSRYGWVEYYGPEADGEHRLRVYTSSARLIRPLRALRGVHAQQVGDQEARFWFKAGEPEVLRAVCKVIKARTRRVVSADQAERFRR